MSDLSLYNLSNKTNRPRNMYPQIGHDHLIAENVTWCEGAGCYSLNLTYDVPIQQIEALIAMSDTCEQEIKFEVLWKSNSFIFLHSFVVQVGPFEECCIWIEVWVVDEPT